jgi:hypothetical protein
MFWRRSDREKIEGPAGFVWPVKEEAQDDEAINPPRNIAIHWHGPFAASDKALAELAGKPLLYVTIRPAAQAPDAIERVGYTRNGNINYLSQRITEAGMGWVGSVQNFDQLEALSDEAFKLGDQDAVSDAEFDANLALLRRVFSYTFRPRLTRIHQAVDAVPAPLRIVNSWSRTRTTKEEFCDYCPDSITFFRNAKVRAAWNDQARYFTWTARQRQRPAETPIVPQQADAPDRKTAPWPLIAGILALLLVGGAVGIWLWPSGAPGLGKTVDMKLQSALDAAQARIAALTADIEKSAAQIQSLRAQLSTALAKIAGLEKENADLTAQLSQPASTRPPLELDSCWSREGQRAVPVYRVTIRDNDFLVEPSWKDSRDWPAPFAEKMGDLRPLSEPATLAPSAFSATMFPYYEQGIKPDMNCRFFVDVIDRTTNKDTWKTGLAMVERYFYKRLIP